MMIVSRRLQVIDSRRRQDGATRAAETACHQIRKNHIWHPIDCTHTQQTLFDSSKLRPTRLIIPTQVLLLLLPPPPPPPPLAAGLLLLLLPACQLLLLPPPLPPLSTSFQVIETFFLNIHN